MQNRKQACYYSGTFILRLVGSYVNSNRKYMDTVMFYCLFKSVLLRQLSLTLLLLWIQLL